MQILAYLNSNEVSKVRNGETKFRTPYMNTNVGRIRELTRVTPYWYTDNVTGDLTHTAWLTVIRVIRPTETLKPIFNNDKGWIGITSSFHMDEDVWNSDHDTVESSSHCPITDVFVDECGECTHAVLRVYRHTISEDKTAGIIRDDNVSISDSWFTRAQDSCSECGRSTYPYFSTTQSILLNHPRHATRHTSGIDREIGMVNGSDIITTEPLMSNVNQYIRSTPHGAFFYVSATSLTSMVDESEHIDLFDGSVASHVSHLMGSELYSSRETGEIRMATCSYCGGQFERGSDVSLVARSEYVCDACTGLDHASVIHNYSWNPPEFNYYRMEDEEHKSTSYRGIEMEVEIHTDVATSSAARQFGRAANAIFPSLFYLKSDASIDVGFEIVTHPMSERWINSNADKWAAFFDMIEIQGLRAGIRDGVISCGMHIHVSTAPVPSDTLYKASAFVYNNKEPMLLMADRFNRRRIDRYCYFPSNMNDGDFRSMGSNKRNCPKIEHHAVLQFTQHTMEFRIMDGVSSFIPFMKNVQMVNAVMEFSRISDISDMSFDNFLDFVIDNADDYTELSNDITQKSIKYEKITKKRGA